LYHLLAQTQVYKQPPYLIGYGKATKLTGGREQRESDRQGLPDPNEGNANGDNQEGSRKQIEEKINQIELFFL
jgi:hypothetical protein